MPTLEELGNIPESSKTVPDSDGKEQCFGSKEYLVEQLKQLKTGKSRETFSVRCMMHLSRTFRQPCSVEVHFRDAVKIYIIQVFTYLQMYKISAIYGKLASVNVCYGLF